MKWKMVFELENILFGKVNMGSNNEYEQQQFWKPKLFVSKAEWDFIQQHLKNLEDNYKGYYYWEEGEFKETKYEKD